MPGLRFSKKPVCRGVDGAANVQNPASKSTIQAPAWRVGTGIWETFINKAGGLDAKIIVVPTNGGNKTPDGQIREYKEEQAT